MKGGKPLVGVLALSLAGCLGSTAELNIRPTPTPPSLTAKPVPERIAEARGQLAIGNVAMALELFRRASREDPASTDALAGMAHCYDLMGRYDLSRRYLEQGLALVPADGQLLTALAVSLERQGKVSEAQSVRRELALRTAAPTKVADTTQLPVPEPQPIMAAPSVTVALPAPQLAGQGPRLERVSLTEVALVTVAKPRWQRDLGAQTKARSIPSKSSDVRLASVRLLNAARVPGLAARTRLLLRDKGWSVASIGDSARVRQQSLVLYSERQEAQARRLAALLGVPLARQPRPGAVTVLLGADVAAKGGKRG